MMSSKLPFFLAAKEDACPKPLEPRQNQSGVRNFTAKAWEPTLPRWSSDAEEGQPRAPSNNASGKTDAAATEPGRQQPAGTPMTTVANMRGSLAPVRRKRQRLLCCPLGGQLTGTTGAAGSGV